MIDVAIKHELELKKLFSNIIFDKKYMYYNGGSYYDDYESIKTTWTVHEFVSISTDGKVIGYIKYNVDRDALKCYALQIINFSENKAVFGNDVMKCLEDVFIKFNFNKLSYCVIVGNPIESTYDRLTKKYGGTIVGVKEKDSRLIDGNLYDLKMYEILKDNLVNNLRGKQI